MNLVLLGPPGSGKGTQAKRISAEKAMAHLSTGDMLRSAIREGTKVGLEAKSIMERGELVSDVIVIQLIRDRIKKDDCKVGFILDGFPRNRSQAKALDELLKSEGKRIDQAISFSITDEAIVARLSGRRTCQACDAMYHIKHMPPKKDGICDNDGKALVQRKDDQPEVIRNRLAVYHKETEPVIGYYEEKDLLSQLDATLDAEAVAKAIGAVLSKAKGQ